ncbi:choline/ethanolamine kinase-like [Periplaneta americana]|uniref:choline/ethanolamine kinase-like n=1 Tax=Periplaneta americana TaxID=6978 RepID=UPI0037E779DE
MIIQDNTMVSSEDSSLKDIEDQEEEGASRRTERLDEAVAPSAETALPAMDQDLSGDAGELAVRTTELTSLDADIRERAHKLCHEYLRGAWKRISAQELVIKKVSGGLSNLLYYCALPACRPTIHGEPSRVLLRLYGQLHGERALEGLVTEAVIFTMLSESQRGPRLLGVFPGGRLEEYIPARPLLTRELSDPVLSQLVAQKLAQIHMMDVPINKEPRWLWDTMNRWLDSIQDFTSLKHEDPVSKTRANKLMSYSLRLELDWLKEFLVSIRSPVVFCHNDLQEGNILLRLDGEESQVSQPELVVIDFEFCSYNYRGFDFANHMCEWVYDYSNEEPPYFWASHENFPSLKEQEHFLESYLQVIHKEKHGSTQAITRNELDQLLRELQAFTLASHFFWGLWSVCYASISTIPFDYWEYGEVRFEAYFKHKAHLLNAADESSASKNITDLMKSL